MDDDLKRTIKALGLVSTVGMAMALSIALGAGIGYYLDAFFGTRPWLSLVFLGFGIAAAFRSLYMIYKKAKIL
jgi:ATP synthase protein I